VATRKENCLCARL